MMLLSFSLTFLTYLTRRLDKEIEEKRLVYSNLASQKRNSHDTRDT